MKVHDMNIKTHGDYGPHAASYSTGTGVPSQRSSGKSVMLTSHLSLTQSLRMSGTIPLLLIHTFMSWTETNIHLYTHVIVIQTGSKMVLQVWSKHVG
jgi:hypothetical protein